MASKILSYISKVFPYFIYLLKLINSSTLIAHSSILFAQSSTLDVKRYRLATLRFNYAKKSIFIAKNISNQVKILTRNWSRAILIVHLNLKYAL